MRANRVELSREHNTLTGTRIQMTIPDKPTSRFHKYTYINNTII